MITKIILTLLVIAAGYIYLKRKSAPQSSASARQQDTVSVSASSAVPVKLIAALLIAIFSVATLSYIGYHWFDNNRVLEVRLISPGTDQHLIYEVRKGDLKERSFTTTDGQIVRIGASERLEVRATEH